MGIKATDALKGAIVAVATTFLLPILLAYSFRFPVPLVGYFGPLGEFNTYDLSVHEVLKSVLLAWTFYGMVGGFTIVPVCGALTGLLVSRKDADARGKNGRLVFWSTIVGAIPVLILSTLDYIIGPW